MSPWTLGLRVFRPSAAGSTLATECPPRGSPKFARTGKRNNSAGIILFAMPKINLVALGVSDISKSVAFYKDKAGFELQNQFGGIAFFSGGPVTLMLNTELRRPNAPLAGATEIVVAADSVTAAH